MLSDLQRKFKEITRLWVAMFLATAVTDIVFKLGLVFIWNWLFGMELNCLLFGEETLNLVKGFVFISLLIAGMNKGNPLLLTVSKL